MHEEWKEIKEFPGYAVSSHGRVRNEDWDRYKDASVNQSGVHHVLLMKNGRQCRRSVAGLVADAFVDPPRYEHFNALIHLDGDRSNCAADNLAWRPRWFAIKYHKQFQPGALRGFLQPIYDLETGETFDNSWQAAVKYGLIDHEIRVATHNRTYVFPTGQQFRIL